MTDTFNPVAALNAANAAVGGKVDPQTVVNVVKSAKSIDEATTNIQAIAHTGNIVQMFDTLNGMSPSQQASAWQGLEPAEQNSLRNVGFTPPDLGALSHAGAGGQHGGIWSDISSGVSQGLHDVGGAATAAVHGVERGASDVMSGLNKGLSNVQHVYRAAHAVAEIGIASGEGWNTAYQDAQHGGVNVTDTNQYKDLFSPSAWAQAWDMTANGNTQIDPAVNRHLVGQYGQKQVSLAIRVGNEGADAIVAAAPPAQQQALLTQTQDPKFQALVSQVTNGKMSLGREAVGTAFLANHPAAAKVISGTIDAATDILSDPTLKLGKVAEAGKIARYGVADASRAADIIHSDAGVQRLASRIDPLLAQGRYGELGRVDPRLDSISEELQRSGIDSGTKFKDWLANTAGQAAMLSGRVAKISHEVPIVPHMTYLGWMKSGIKEALSNGIDHLADGGADKALSDIKLDPTDIGGAGDPVHTNIAGQVANAVDMLNAGKVAGGVGRIPGVANVARLVRRTTTLIPSKPFINIAETTRDENGIALDTGPDVSNFRRYIQGFLPARKVDQLSNVFVNADEGQRRLLVTAAIKQNFHAAGLYNTDDGAQAADAALAGMDDLIRKQAYSVNGLDKLPDDNDITTRHALLEVQKSNGLAIPMPSVVRKLVRANGILGAAGVDPMTGVEGVMKLWRTMVLDRPGFAARMALDENLNRLLRTSPKALLGSFLGNGAARTRTDEEISHQVEGELAKGSLHPDDAIARQATLRGLSVKSILPYHPTERALQILTDHAPEGIRPHIKNAAEWYGAVFGGKTRQWARKAEAGGLKALGLDKYIEGGTHLATHQPVMDAAEDYMASGRGAEGFGWSPESQVKMMREGGKAVIAKFNKRAPFSEAAPGDFGYHFRWQVGLDQIAHSQLGRAALETINNDRRTSVRAVMGVLNDPSFATEKKGFVWAKQLRDGRRVGVDATQDEADRSFARQIVDHTRAHLTSGVYTPTHQGPVLQKLVNHMLDRGAAPEMDKLTDIGGHDLPNGVYGPDVVPVHKFSGFLSKTFEEMVGKPMNWMSRQPHFIHQYTDALAQTRPFAESIHGAGQNAEQLASDLASQRAVNAMVPYIHNPELRTQFEDYHRTLFPFLFAQRQFLQRWGRTFADSPSAMRELQLTTNALRTTGIIKRDQSGNDYFYYPGSQYVTEMIAGTLNQLGIHSTIPFMTPFTGEVKYLMPGLSNPVTPSVGPFAAVAMKELAKVMPEMTGFNQAILGQGAGEGVIQQFTPSIVNRLYNALGPEESGSQLASTMAMGMKFLDAAGHGLPDNPTEGQTELYVARVQNWARSLLVARAMLGFVLPATPTAGLDPSGLDARYKALLSELPYNEATAEFIKEHPDAVAYTVGSTEGATEGGLPSTEADLKFTNENVGFAKDYPAAFPWLAPRSPGTFSLTEFSEQGATGQRTAKPIWDPAPGSHSVVADIINARAAPAYYGTVDNYEAQYTALGADTAGKKALTQAYDQWKVSFFARNPLFSQYIDTKAGHVSRVNTLREVRQALDDPQLPHSPAVPNLKVMVNTYDQFVSEYNQYAGNNSTAAYDAKTSIKNNMIAWGTQAAKDAPDVTDFWNTIIRPEVDSQA